MKLIDKRITRNTGKKTHVFILNEIANTVWDVSWTHVYASIGPRIWVNTYNEIRNNIINK